MKITQKNFRKYQVYALVTGAASGMGRIYAKVLASKGYNIIAVDINSKMLDETVDIVKEEVKNLSDFRSADKANFNIIPVVQDLSQKEAASKIFAIAEEAGCEVEVLVNNAGIMYCHEICYTPERMLDIITMVHMYTPLMLCRAFVPKMRERGNGYVLNVSSLAEAMNWPAIGMYGSTKRFVKDFSRGLRVECQKTGVSVTNAYFGAVDTPLIPISPALKKLARNLLVMIRPEVAVDKALAATFKRRKGTMPGLLNKIFYPLILILPDWLLGVLYRKCTFIRTKF
jgi:short-subunit dehydrogenase